MNAKKLLLTITEVGMILYWIFASLVALDIVLVAPEIMYSDYENPTVVAWNWSFFALDIAFAIAGLYSRYGRVTGRRQVILSTFSLALMFCAGLMAISFWVVVGSFDLFWWGMNIWLMLLAGWVLAGSYLAQE